MLARGELAPLALNPSLLAREELAALTLRALYAAKGYRRFRMNKFEQYDLYARNKDFLVSEAVLTFTDPGGRLMALRPDVTLSIVQGYRGEELLRLQYHEQVYRLNPEGEAFEEIPQSGIECLGAIGEQEVLEVLMLAMQSLQALGEQAASAQAINNNLKSEESLAPGSRNPSWVGVQSSSDSGRQQNGTLKSGNNGLLPEVPERTGYNSSQKTMLPLSQVSHQQEPAPLAAALSSNHGDLQQKAVPASCSGNLEQETAQTLGTHSLPQSSLLTLSHRGLQQEALDGVTDQGLRREVIGLIGQKNPDALRQSAQAAHLSESQTRKLLALIELSGEPDSVLPGLENAGFTSYALSELRSLCAALKRANLNPRLRLDFSIDGGSSYYDGVLFQGFLPGLPKRVLSGGRYDPLLKRLGKQGGAVGFALYLDQLPEGGQAC